MGGAKYTSALRKRLMPYKAAKPCKARDKNKARMPQ